MKEKTKYTVFLLAVLLVLGGCSGTGGTFGNLVPLPKLLRGTVEGNVYYAPDRSFSVATPHPSTGSGRETYEWTYAKVKEGEDEGLRFVEFGPFAWDLSRYSVDVFPPAPGVTLDKAADNYFRHVMEGDAEQFESLSHAETTLTVGVPCTTPTVIDATPTSLLRPSSTSVPNMQR
jgi:hypothetical protein